MGQPKWVPTVIENRSGATNICSMSADHTRGGLNKQLSIVTIRQISDSDSEHGVGNGQNCKVCIIVIALLKALHRGE